MHRRDRRVTRPLITPTFIWSHVAKEMYTTRQAALRVVIPGKAIYWPRSEYRQFEKYRSILCPRFKGSLLENTIQHTATPLRWQAVAMTNLHFDHDLPFSKGGTSISAKNVRLLCMKHNLQKSARIEWRLNPITSYCRQAFNTAANRTPARSNCSFTIGSAFVSCRCTAMSRPGGFDDGV